MRNHHQDERAAPPAATDHEYAWFRDGNLPHTRADLVAEAFALFALLFALGIGLMIALLPASAHAAVAATAPDAAASGPSLELAAYKVVAAVQGTAEHLVPAAQAHAGDRLEYQAVYRNPTAAPVRHVVVTVPVPADGVEYVLDTASPRADFASTDGKHFDILPLKRVETTSTGAQVTHAAPAADYRFLRWNLGDVPAGAVRTVHARVRLVAGDTAAH